MSLYFPSSGSGTPDPGLFIFPGSSGAFLTLPPPGFLPLDIYGGGAAGLWGGAGGGGAG